MKNVLIEPVLNGFILTVGCSRVCFNDIDTLCRELKRYHKDPDHVEMEYQKGAINKSMLTPPAVGYPEMAISSIPNAILAASVT